MLRADGKMDYECRKSEMRKFKAYYPKGLKSVTKKENRKIENHP